MASKNEIDHTRAISLLRGTHASFIASVIITVASAVLILHVLYLMVNPTTGPGLPSHASLYMGQSCVFLTAMTFFGAKTMRDGFTASLPNAPEGARFVKGSWEWQLGVAVAAGIAFLFMLHSLYTLAELPMVEFEPFFVLCLGSFFLIASSANLAKGIRDRSDANVWEHAKDPTAAIFELVKGTNANTILVFGSFAIAVASIVVGVIFFDHMSIETRGFLMMGTAFLLVSAFWLGKIVRDSATPADSPLQPQAKDWALAINSMGLSSVMVFGGLFVYTSTGVLSFNKSLFFATNFFFALFTTSWVSKWMRDRAEISEMQMAGELNNNNNNNNRPVPSAPAGKAM